MGSSELQITVLFTSHQRTKAALKAAARLAAGLNANIQMMVLRVVPFPLALSCPPVSLQFDRRQARRLAKSAGVDTNVHVYDCRDAEETILKMLPEHSVVVIGSRWKWHLVRVLKQNGHDPVVVH